MTGRTNTKIWRQEEIQKLDRNMLTIHRLHYLRADIDHLCSQQRGEEVA
jgi:hypothetical protein